jgi:hypothetical protein
MGKRVAIKIYKVGKRILPDELADATESSYLQGLTDVNVVKGSDGKKTILVKLENLPGASEWSILKQFPNGIICELREWIYNDSSVVTYTVAIDGSTYNIRSSTTSDISRYDYFYPFEFYVNPDNITPSYKKLLTEVRTRGAWEIQHWGDQITEIRVEGRTGGLHTIGKKVLTPDQDVTQSTAWKKISELKSLYLSDHDIKNSGSDSLLGMNYYDRFFIGYFSDFTGPIASSENPYIMKYAFTFKVQEETSTAVFSI